MTDTRAPGGTPAPAPRPPWNPLTVAMAARAATRPFPGLPPGPSRPEEPGHGWTPVDPPNWEERRAGVHRHPPRSPVAHSYAGQWYRLRGRFDLHPVPGPDTDSEPDSTVDPSAGADEEPLSVVGLGLPAPVHLLTGWNPTGRGRTRAENRRRQHRMRESAGAAGGRVTATMATVADDWSWAEEVLVVAGLDDDRALTLAAAAGQAAVVRWDATALAVLPTGREPLVPASVSAWRASVPVAGCALSGVNAPCRMRAQRGERTVPDARSAG